ncbi:MAG: hypothetical protein AB1717_09410 [Pseudomonadota bacterium]
MHASLSFLISLLGIALGITLAGVWGGLSGGIIFFLLQRVYTLSKRLDTLAASIRQGEGQEPASLNHIDNEEHVQKAELLATHQTVPPATIEESPPLTPPPIELSPQPSSEPAPLRQHEPEPKPNLTPDPELLAAILRALAPVLATAGAAETAESKPPEERHIAPHVTPVAHPQPSESDPEPLPPPADLPDILHNYTAKSIVHPEPAHIVEPPPKAHAVGERVTIAKLPPSVTQAHLELDLLRRELAKLEEDIATERARYDEQHTECEKQPVELVVANTYILQELLHEVRRLAAETEQRRAPASKADPSS